MFPPREVHLPISKMSGTYSSRRSLWAMKAAFAFSWGHVACAFMIVGLDTFFSNHRCKNIHPEATFALSWGHVHYAFKIVGFDTFFLNHRCKNFHVKRPQSSHHNPPNRQYGRICLEMQILCSCSQTHFPTSHMNDWHEDSKGIFSHLFLVTTHNVTHHLLHHIFNNIFYKII